VAAWLRTRGERWDTSEQAPTRPAMLTAWAVGFVAYQVINPGYLAHWSTFWTKIGEHLHTIGHTWLSASITAFLVSVVIALPFAGSGSASDAAPERAGSAPELATP